MKVLFFIARYQRMAGASRSLYSLIAHLPDEVEPIVVVAKEGAVYEAFKALGVRTELLQVSDGLQQFGRGVIGWSLFEQLRIGAADVLPYARRLARRAKELGADLIHTNSLRGGIIGGLASKLCGVPMVLHLQTQTQQKGVPKLIAEYTATRIISVAHAIVEPSVSPRFRDKVVVQHHGIEDVAGHEGRIGWLQGMREQGVVVVSSLISIVPFKGVHTYLRAIAELNRRGYADRAMFLAVGDFNDGYDGYRRMLMAERDQLGVGNLTFAGWQNDPYSFHCSSDVLVLPTVQEEEIEIEGETDVYRVQEGFPVSILEGMCFSLPVVATNVVGVPEEVADGETGFVVTPSDPIAMADALEKLILDPELRRRFGDAGRARVRDEFSIETFVGGVMAVYHDVLR